MGLGRLFRVVVFFIMFEMFSFWLMNMYADYVLLFIASSLYTTCVSIFSSISMIVCAYCWRHFTD